ncbi:MAG: zinc dependent phospholipase C family protein [Terriglobales bacterium]
MGSETMNVPATRFARMIPKSLTRIVSILLFICFASSLGFSYSVLTHEEIVDLLWKDQIQPLLLKRFPHSTPDDLTKAHAYAYGGSLIQDMGYYPFGSAYFSNLVHYVRSGDFVVALVEQSQDVNEYAFALGALAHYASDNMGHPAINQSVALSFPKLRRKYGSVVTYEDDHKAHIQTEFGFDMVQVAKNRYTSDRYHDFIGFEVSKPVLERAFLQTYDLKVQDVFGDEDLAIGTFRRSVSNVIPEMTRVALLNRKKEVIRDSMNPNEKLFLYHLSRTKYQKEWGKGYRRPGFGARVLAFFLRIVPKIGPFRALNFKIPSTKTEDLYVKSINKSITEYGTDLKETKHGELDLPNMDFDTGRPTTAGEYKLADTTYARLLDDLDKKRFDQLTPELKQNILDFFASGTPVIAKKKDKKDVKAWQKTQDELSRLKTASVQPFENGGAATTPSE